MNTNTPSDHTEIQSQPEQPVYIPYTPQDLGTEPEQEIQSSSSAVTTAGVQPVSGSVPNVTPSEPTTPAAPPAGEAVQKQTFPVATTAPFRINLQKIRSEVEKFTPFILAILAICTGIMIFTVIQVLQPEPEQPMPVTIVITPTPTPTPIRTPTNVSTSSAFLTFVDDVNTLQNSIRDFEKDDPMLSPPALVLPLGF